LCLELEGGLPLFTEMPRRFILVKRASSTTLSRKMLSETQGLRKARREEGSTTNTMMRTNPTTVIVAATCRAVFGPPDYPPAASSRLSTQTIMLSQIPHFLSIHKYSLYCLEELFSETAALSGPGRDRERIFMPRCIKVPASKLCNRGERAHSPGPNA